MFGWVKKIFEVPQETDEQREKRIQRQIYRKAVQQALVVNHNNGGIIVVIPKWRKIERFCSLGSVIRCKDDLAHHHDWVVIDLDKGFDNIQYLRQDQIDDIVDLIDIEDFITK